MIIIVGILDAHYLYLHCKKKVIFTNIYKSNENFSLHHSSP
jgi:hypothetical protein